MREPAPSLFQTPLRGLARGAENLVHRNAVAHARDGVQSRTNLELFRPLVRSAMLVLLVFIVGVIGFVIIGGAEASLVDAVYMTVITLTTVGFGEVIDLSNNPGGRIFTTVLLLGGVGAFLGFFSTATAFFVEGSAQHLLWRKRMTKAIARLSGHTIVCGGGYTGGHVVRELAATGRSFVLIEQSVDSVKQLTELAGSEFPVVLGDATEDDALTAAGVERAERLVACISNDKDNLIITISARILNPELRIVCRCVDERHQGKIRKAGADSVVSLSRIGGLRLVSEAVRPVAVEYLDRMLREGEKGLRVESTRVEAGSELDSATVGDVKRRDLERTVLLAVCDDDDRWTYVPPDDTKLEPGTTLVYMAPPAARADLERAARRGDRRP